MSMEIDVVKVIVRVGKFEDGGKDLVWGRS